MQALYPNSILLPSLITLILAGCDTTSPPETAAEQIPDVFLQALQEAEALRHDIEQHKLQQQQIDALLRPAQPAMR